MLGQALVSAARARGCEVIGAARSGADRAIDFVDGSDIAAIIDDIKPTHVVNSAAIVSIEDCEKDPCAAFTVNGRAVALMAEACRLQGIPLLHISTDHFFTGDRDRMHDEDAPVQLVNEYARSKYAGERFALTVPTTLVIRTNVTGLRGWQGRPTFFEWAAELLTRRAPLCVYDDFYTSTIDAGTLAIAIMDLLERRATGVLNVAAREVAHKKQFIDALALRMGIAFDWGTVGSATQLMVRRAESAGLDVSRAESVLGYHLPDTASVVAALVESWRARNAIRD